GSVGVAILGHRGFQVTASSGRPEQAEYLKSLGATEIIETQRPRRTRKTAGKRALGGRHRRGRLDLARRCAFDDALRRGGGRLWAGGGGGGLCARRRPRLPRRGPSL